MENPEGRGGHTANPFRGGGMDIFWNHTLFNIFKLDCTAFQAMLCFLTRLCSYSALLLPCTLILYISRYQLLGSLLFAVRFSNLLIIVLILGPVHESHASFDFKTHALR